MEVIKTNIPMKDVAKVMREVGYNKSEPGTRSSAIAAQIAEAEARPKKTLDDAINASMAKITPNKPSVVLPKSVPVKKVEPEIEIDELEVEAAPKVPITEVHLGEPKTVTIDMTTIETKVTFTGPGWIIRDIKIAYMELIKAFQIKIRDEYRKGIK